MLREIFRQTREDPACPEVAIPGGMMKCYCLMSMFQVFVCVLLVTYREAFCFNQKLSLSRSSTRIDSVENWISGVTNSPPSKLLLTQELKESLTSGTSLQDKELACVFKASQDGWSAIDFHQCVDGKGSALVVALSRSGQVFGGFNPLGWRSTDDYYQSNAAFLWYGNKGERCPILLGGACHMT